MYCPNCGNDMKDSKYCSQCGFTDEVVQPTPTEPTTKPAKSSKGGVAAIITIIVIGVVAVIAVVALILIFAFKYINKLEISDFISLKDVKISSIYRATGNKMDICNTKANISDNEAEFKISFCDGMSKKDIEKYVDYLIIEDGFVLYEGSFEYNLKKQYDDRTVYVFIVDNSTIIYSFHRGTYDVENQKIGV